MTKLTQFWDFTLCTLSLKFTESLCYSEIVFYIFARIPEERTTMYAEQIEGSENAN